MLSNSINLLTRNLNNWGKKISKMFLKAIKNFCSLSLQLTSFNQNSLCLKTKIFSVCLCLLCRPVDFQMGIRASQGLRGTVCSRMLPSATHMTVTHSKEVSFLKGQQSQR